MLRRIILTALAVAMLAGLAPRAGAEVQTHQTASFSGAYYYSIDVSQAAKDQYGWMATAELICDHLYCWRAKLNGRFYGLDMKKAVATQYGSSYRLVATGVHAYDWKAFKPSQPQNWVLPVMVVASDRWFDIQGVRDALARFGTVLSTTRNWFDYRAAETFRYLQPVVMYSGNSSQWWNDTSYLTTNPAYRSALFDAVVAVHQANLPLPGSNLRVAASISVTNGTDYWWGAASNYRVAVAPQRATSITCPASGTQDYRCADATYAVGHELGHTWLGGNDRHSCTAYPSYPNCSDSIMQNGKPWDAILLAPEATDLRASPFFS